MMDGDNDTDFDHDEFIDNENGDDDDGDNNDDVQQADILASPLVVQSANLTHSRCRRRVPMVTRSLVAPIVRRARRGR